MYISDTAQTELAYLGFCRILPSPALQSYVECYWLIDARVEQPHLEHMHPDGGSGLMFNFGDPLMQGEQPVVGNWSHGVPVTSQPIRLFGAVSCLGVHFRPGGGFPFSKAYLDSPDLTPLDGLFADLSELNQRLWQEGDIRQKAALLDQWLLAALVRFQPDLDDQRLILHAQRLIGKATNGRIQDVAEQLGVSTRRLERLFRSRVGLSPKVLSRLSRFAMARHYLKYGDHLSLSDVALEAGFFDQAHFNHEFRRLLGMTPKAYRLRHQDRLN